jgi:hypothetical protein
MADVRYALLTMVFSLDPVVRAHMENARKGIVYGKKQNPAKSWYNSAHSVITSFDSSAMVWWDAATTRARLCDA